MSRWTERLIGVLLLGLALLLAMAAVGHLVPDRAGTYITTQARMLDSLRPHILLAVPVLAALLALLGAGRIALAWVLGAALVALSLGADYRARSAPVADPSAPADLTLLWMNILESNPAPPETLAAAIRAAAPDIVALGESRPAAALPGLLADLYPHRLGCTDPDACGVLVLSRLPLRATAIRDLPSGQERMARMLVDLPDGRSVRLVVAHLVKPWFTGMAGTERNALNAMLGGKRDLPLIVAGDFNAAPWSRRLRQIERRHALRHAPRPLATWPVEAGRFGVPIDHVLLRGAGFAGIETWGAGLGSNHLGLLAGITLPVDGGS